MNLSQIDRPYTQAELRLIFRSNPDTIPTRLIKRGLVHAKDCTPHHINELARFLATGVAHSYWGPRRLGVDSMHVLLWYLQQQYDNPTPPEELAGYRAAIVRQCEQLAKRGGLVRRTYLLDRLWGISERIITRWLERRRIIGVKIGSSWYLSSNYYNHLLQLFTRWPTIQEVAMEFNVCYDNIRRKCSNGTFPTVVTPDGRTRLNPKVVNKELKRRAAESLTTAVFLTTAAARDRLGITQGVIDSALLRGYLPCVTDGNQHLIAKAEVLAWEKRFKTINPGFEWLQAQHERGGAYKLLAAKSAYRQLRTNIRTFGLWNKENLLPFYVRSFTPGGRKLFPALYIFGLLRFAKQQGVEILNAPLLRRYRQICNEQKIVV